MQDYESMKTAVKAFEAMSPEYRRATLLQLLHDETINILEAVSSFGTYLEEYKADSRNDMRVMSEAGLSLAEKEIKKIPSVKSDNRRQLMIAQTHSLLDGGGFHTTPYAEKIRSYADLSEVDAKWYEGSWKLKRPLVEQEGKTNG